jgi:hypothetical protein
MNAQRFKGQVSLEYLMTYGIAIAIVVIAVAALYSMGVFNSNASSSPPCTNCFSDFAYNAHSFSSNTLALEVKNGPTALGSMSCTFTNGTCVVQSSALASSVFSVNATNTSAITTSATITLYYTKSGSSLNTSRTQTVGKDYFK